MRYNQLEIQNNLLKASEYVGKNDFQSAINIYEKIAKESPENFIALFNLAIIAHMANNKKAAEVYAIRASLLECDIPERAEQICNILYQIKKYNEAYLYISKITNKFPEHGGCFYMQGLVCTKLKKFDAALESFDKALIYKANGYNTYLCIANIYSERKHTLDANLELEALKKAISVDPEKTLAYNKLGTFYTSQGKFAEAVDVLEKALKINPNDIGVYYNISRIKKFKNSDYEFSNKPHEILASGNLNFYEKRTINYTLGKFYDDIGNYKKAFKHYEQANALDPDNEKSIINQYSKQTDAIRNTITRQFLDDRKDFGSSSSLPIFIVGMPRSGTTLIEQIISSHSQVTGCDELDYISKLATKASDLLKKPFSEFPNSLNELSIEDSKQLSKIYLDSVAKLYNGSPKHITDKLPLNFQYVGLINLLFPNAKVINCQRHPLDACLSTFFQHFNTNISIFRDLEEIAMLCKIYYNIMEYWNSILPGVILDIKYEKMIEDQHSTSCKIMNFLSLELEDSCLNFYKNKRSVFTSSDTQVRKPIYKTSMMRWKNYEPWLKPAKDILEKEIKEYEKNL